MHTSNYEVELQCSIFDPKLWNATRKKDASLLIVHGKQE